MNFKYVLSLFLSSVIFAGNPVAVDSVQVRKYFSKLTIKEQETLSKKMFPAFESVSKKIDEVLKLQNHITIKFVDKDYNKKTDKFSKSFEELMVMILRQLNGLGCNVQTAIFDGDETGTFGIIAELPKSDQITI